MPLKRSQIRAWVQWNWFVTLVVVFALLLGFAQAWLHWAFHPPILVDGLIGVVAIAALCGWVLLILRLRRPLSDLRYRWLTRGVDRATRKTAHRRTRVL